MQRDGTGGINTVLQQRGAFGIPTFFVGKEIFFGKQRFCQLEEELIRQGL